MRLTILQAHALRVIIDWTLWTDLVQIY